MPINLLNNYDKYGFALKSVKKTYLNETYDPYIEVKYVTNEKYKNINSYGAAFRDFTYSLNAKNNKETIINLYNDLKDKNIFESTKYLISQYPENIENIVYSIPSFVIANKDFMTYLIDETSTLPEETQIKIKRIIEKKFYGINKFLNSRKLNEIDTL